MAFSLFAWASAKSGQIEAESQVETDLQSVELYGEDDDFYVQCVQNLNQGNPVEIVANQIPGSIYVKEDQVYFINVSDSRTLYHAGTDGKEEEKIIHKGNRIWDILPYQENLYWVDVEQEQLVCLNAQGEESFLVEREKAAENGSQNREDAYACLT